ncbi:MAG: gliding motility-associated C-terminal domain-containing protein, partial [Chitinophagaceae bacterium]|nr:gliding motility-associated C-terminal domain-containing protein [Chitinophagaceae bacterium]
ADGDNDYFLPRQLLSAGLTAFKMDIFNRWGELIYSTSSIDGRGWDGNFNDTKQPMGVYIYVVNAEFKNKVKRTFQGNVTLIR